jgi:acyl carrier protein
VSSTEDQIMDNVRVIISEVAGVPLEDITPGKRFVEDLGVDSLSMIEVVVQAQRDFGVVIPDDRLRELSTVADVVRYIGTQSASTGELLR